VFSESTLSSRDYDVAMTSGMPTALPSPTVPSVVSRLTLAQQIRDRLVVAIVSGEIQPGERLVETRLAARYGTSQAPVREALRELEAMRMVETRPRRGTFVRHFVQQTLRESYVVRAALEETATRLAMLSGSMPIAALRNEVKAMRAAARAADDNAAARASVAFHRHIIDAAHNELLKLSWEALQIEARTAVTSRTSRAITPSCCGRSNPETSKRPAGTPGITSGTTPTYPTTRTGGSVATPADPVAHA
jgi:DNA-binding GntR family transcriptional regulator